MSSVKDNRKKMIMNLLIRAIKKYRELENDDFWKNELVDAPPILWFGNMDSPREKILTIAANPSCHEFDPCVDRFKIDKNWKLLPDIENEEEKESIYKSFVNSYNNYFEGNPYTKWFGKKEGARLEGFINGFNGTFYEDTKYFYQAIHIDLFPFATRSPFMKIKDRAKQDLFNKNECWGQRFLLDLIKLAEPKLLILFAKTNMEIFEDIHRRCTYSFRKIKEKNLSEFGICKEYDLEGYKIYAMASIYPPRPQSSLELRELGKRFFEEVIQETSKNSSWF